MRLHPSNAHLWVPCPGYPTIRGDIEPLKREDHDNRARDMGIKAHLRAADYLRGKGWNVDELDSDYQECVKTYVDHVQAISTGDVRGEEEKLACPLVQTDPHEMPRAIVDAYHYDEITRELAVWELKTGVAAIEAEGNYQGAIYLDALVETCNLSPLFYKFFVVQPRAYHPDGPIRQWSPTTDELTAVCNKIRTAAMATANDPVCKPGPHCKQCDCRHACEALRKAVELSNHLVYDTTVYDQDMQTASLEWIMLKRSMEILKARLTGIEAQIKHHAIEGQVSQHLTVEPSTTAPKWTHDPATITSLCDLNGVDVRKPLTVKTPLQAIAAGMPEEVVTAWSRRQAGPLKIKEIK